MNNGKLHQYAPADFITIEVEDRYKLQLQGFGTRNLEIYIGKEGSLGFFYNRNLFEVKLKVVDLTDSSEKYSGDATDSFDLVRLLHQSDKPTVEIMWKRKVGIDDDNETQNYTKLSFDVLDFFKSKDVLKPLIPPRVEKKQEDVDALSPPQRNRLLVIAGVGVAAIGILLVCSKTASSCFTGAKGTSIGQNIMNFFSKMFSGNGQSL